MRFYVYNLTSGLSGLRFGLFRDESDPFGSPSLGTKLRDLGDGYMFDADSNGVAYGWFIDSVSKLNGANNTGGEILHIYKGGVAYGTCAVGSARTGVEPNLPDTTIPGVA